MIARRTPDWTAATIEGIGPVTQLSEVLRGLGEEN